MIFTYCSVALKDSDAHTSAAFASFVAGDARARARNAGGGEVVAFFLPQLGFSSHERAILFRWPDAPCDVLGACDLIGGYTLDRLSATARPAESDQLKSGGIVVHRWFVIRPEDRDEFVALSKAAWVEFESDFETQIFGLFAAEPKAEDGASMRMLLLTRYAGHGEWEKSRAPRAGAAENFRRRHALTKLTRACSTLVAPLA